MKFILASTSINRKKIFDTLGIQYQTHAPEYEEIENSDLLPRQQVQVFSEGKAESVYKKFAKTESNFCIIGFDSMVEIDGKALGKPNTRDEAFEMIQSFVGKSQNIISGVCLTGKFNGKKFKSVFFESTELVFRHNIANSEINKFLDFGDWQGRCGGYAISGTAQFLVASIQGDFQNIIGVPTRRIAKELEKITGQSMFDLVQPKTQSC